MNAVEREILGIANVKASKGETRQAFLERVVRVVNQQPDEVWNKMGKLTRDWTNEASDAVSGGDPIKDFDEVDGDGAEGDGNRDDDAAGDDAAAQDQGGNEMETQTDTGKGGKRKASPKAAAKKAAPKAATKKAAAKVDKPAPKAAVKTAGERKPRKGSDELTESVPTEIKRALIKNDALSTTELMAICQKAGYEAKDSTVRTIASDFRHSLKVLRKAGKL